MKPILKIYMNYFEKLDKLFYCKQGILELEICYQLLIDEHYNYDVSKNILYWSIIGLVCLAILMNSAFKTHVFRHQPKFQKGTFRHLAQQEVHVHRSGWTPSNSHAPTNATCIGYVYKTMSFVCGSDFPLFFF